MKVRIPTLHHHKPSGQARIKHRYKHIYFGPWGEPETEKKYRRWVAEFIASEGVINPADTEAPLLVSELTAQYAAHVNRYYKPDSAEAANIHRAIAALVDLYGDTPAGEFSPRGLKAIRATWLQRKGKPLARGTINRYVRHVVRAFRWAASEGLVPHDVPAALSDIEPLKRGRTKAPEGKRIEPVSEADMNTVLAIAPPTIATMIRIQALTGARPGEVCALRRGDIDTSKPVWIATLREHKTAYIEGAPPRVLAFGPQAQAILKPFMLRADDAHLFSPREAIAQRAAAKPTHRRPEQKPTKRETKRAVGDTYDTRSYRRAIARLCKEAGIEPWGPNALRKYAATKVREKYGLDAAQAILGHSSANTSEIYAKVNEAKVVEIAKELG